MGAQWSQFFPPTPTFTEGDVGTQEGRVFVITGGYSGIGFEISKVLYQHKGRVYIAGRSAAKANEAIKTIRETVPDNNGGSIEFLHLDLEDLSTIKTAAQDLSAKEAKIDVLWNNAGVSQPPIGSVSKQGFELQIAVNCLGPFLFTKLLWPLLEDGAAASALRSGSVRVLWPSSQFMELSAPTGGIVMAELLNPPPDKARNYANSKTGNLFLATEFAKRLGSHSGIVSAAYNPGAASTNLFRHTPWLGIVARPLMHKAQRAALTALYAGLSENIKAETHNGCYVVPWGRISTSLRKDLQNATVGREDGGTGAASDFWDFCEEKTRDYA
ncbi:short-chain dehydrogenase [Apiospora marii]|uniref:short-chain dehydrogenase n=1 Tax=Apiospora marii TaxID=335849 RepID=UPI00312DE39C